MKAALASLFASALLASGCATHAGLHASAELGAPRADAAPAGSGLIRTSTATSSIPGRRAVEVAQLAALSTNTQFMRNRGFGSMRPVFDTNSLLLIERADFGSLRVGDIVMFETSGRTVAHRIIERRGDGFITQGDNNVRPDPRPMTRDTYRYRVWGVIYSDDTSLGTASATTLASSAEVAALD
jgi:hypothetical protein